MKLISGGLNAYQLNKLDDIVDHNHSQSTIIHKTGTNTPKRVGQHVLVCVDDHVFNGRDGVVVSSRAGQVLVSFICNMRHITAWFKHDELKLNIRIVGV